ncbi:ABC sugar transporter, periplasmic ligand binding protein [Caballeronia udeis]|uniref:ABC sugar transporter, periplasmic ligand binding protein n=1 Tax=Caballeronia udeis TaxID=1232866 RepID=A0A158GZ10_9BURK|nr:sugar ABC transporter substrate-binding protein [Caballeronia udeis]SAL37355.1 ABC sugar transporter, periplasmic ligand binding protein [Caballeronia udeis]
MKLIRITRQKCACAIGAAAALAAMMLTVSAAAQSSAPQEFKGYTLRVKLVGGAQYEPLYSAVIPKWEQKTGAKVEILSRKNFFDLNREIKQDIAAGKIDYCVMSNHTSFAPQYGDIYRDLRQLLPASYLAHFGALELRNSTVNGVLVQLPRNADISELYYNKKFYEDAGNKTAYKARYGKDLAPPQTWVEMEQQARFFAKPPAVYGTVFPGKDEAINGRFYEMLVADGGQLFDKSWHPTFNSDAGVRALSFFVDLYKSGAVPKGVPNYLWDDVGQGFASGNVAMDLDWSGWAGYFNDPKNSRVAGSVGVVRAPAGTSGKRTGWSGLHGFSITRTCDNPKAAADFVMALTSLDAQVGEARSGLLPTRIDAQKQVLDELTRKGDPYMLDVYRTFSSGMTEDAFTPPLIPEWNEVSDAMWPELQKAIIGDVTAKQALDDAARKVTDILQDSGRLK